MNLSFIRDAANAIKTTLASCYKSPKTIPSKVQGLVLSTFSQMKSAAFNNPKKTIVAVVIAAVAFQKRAKIATAVQAGFKSIQTSNFYSKVKSFLPSFCTKKPAMDDDKQGKEKNKY